MVRAVSRSSSEDELKIDKLASVFLSASADIEFATSFSWWRGWKYLLLRAGLGCLQAMVKAQAMPPSRLKPARWGWGRPAFHQLKLVTNGESAEAD